MDDIIDTGKTLIKAADALKRYGASQIYAVATHAVLSGGAVERINKSHLGKIVVTNTIQLGKEQSSDKIEILSIADLLGEAIKRIHREVSVSSLFV